MLRSMRKRIAIPRVKKGRQKRRHDSDPGGGGGTVIYATSESGKLADSDNSLDQIKLLTDILIAVADGPLNLPGLKSVAALAGRVVSVAQSVRHNRADCVELAEKVCEHLNLIAVTYHPDCLCPAGTTERGVLVDAECMRSHVDVLCQRLAVVLNSLEHINSRSRWQRTIHYESDARVIASCKDDLQHVFQQFNLATQAVQTRAILNVSQDVKEATRAVRYLIRAERRRGVKTVQITLQAASMFLNLFYFTQS